MKYYTTAYRDSFLVMQKALEQAGSVRVDNYNHADLIFLELSLRWICAKTKIQRLNFGRR